MVSQEVVVPDREPAPLVGHVLVHAVVRLARRRSLGRKGADEIAATFHDSGFYDFAPPETRAMLAQGFRHLPVVQDDRPVGIVSIRDIARWGVREAAD